MRNEWEHHLGRSERDVGGKVRTLHVLSKDIVFLRPQTYLDTIVEACFMSFVQPNSSTIRY